MSQENSQVHIQEDEIDLRELWETLMKRKIFVLLIMALITSVAISYSLLAKPIYEGKVLIEIGEVVNDVNDVNDVQSLSKIKLDSVKNLKVIVNHLGDVSASIPKGTELLELKVNGYDKALIQKNLEQGIDFILKRHNENVKLYSSKNAHVKMTTIIGDIKLGTEPIKPKKTLIVVGAFIASMVLSVFLVFFLEFIQAGRKEEKAI